MKTFRLFVGLLCGLNFANAQTPCTCPPVVTPPAPIANSVCGSATADSHALLLAAIAKGGTITITCPTRLIIGTDYAKPVFIPSNTTINMIGNGQLIVDNILVPAFVMPSSKNVTWNNANILYVGNFGDAAIANDGTVTHNFQYQTLKPYNVAHNGNAYAGPAAPLAGGGSVNMAPIFLVMGQAQNITWNNVSINVPPNVPASHFPASLFSFATDYNPGYHVTNTNADKSLLVTSAPANVTINGGKFDGSIMGFTGEVQSLTASNITSLRYADLQDSNGNNVGGVKNWFAPPHLFYLYEADTDIGNRKGYVALSNIVDQGLRVGNPKMRSANSGSASSFKVDLSHTTVTNYTTHRPDGCGDFFYHFANGPTTITNFTCFMDSSMTTVDGSTPVWGVRFPGPGPDNYTNVTMMLTLTDTAVMPARGILDGMNAGANSNIHINANLYQHNPPPGLSGPEFTGTNIDAEVIMHFSECAKGTRIGQGLNTTLTVIGC